MSTRQMFSFQTIGGVNHKVNYDVMLQVGQRLNEMETARAFQTIHVKYTQQ